MKIEDCKVGMRVISKNRIKAVIRGLAGHYVRISYGYGKTCFAYVLPEGLTAINTPSEIVEATYDAFAQAQ